MKILLTKILALLKIHKIFIFYFIILNNNFVFYLNRLLTFFSNDFHYTFIYDGECPFCNHFAELLEIKSKITNINILDGRKNLTLIELLIRKRL